jgi:hypothetical protein
MLCITANDLTDFITNFSGVDITSIQFNTKNMSTK